jgi:DNA-directed RNA polymerase sigma subunit (sigma70/sigma32)
VTIPRRRSVEELLGNIDTLDAEIIGLSFGLDGEPMTDEQIAEWVGLSRSRVTQRRLRGMQTMSDGEQS